MNASVSPPRLSTSLVLLLVVALLPLFGLVTYTSLQNQQDSLAHTRDHLLGTARLTALRHERTVEGARQLLGAIASAPVVKGLNLPGCTVYLKALHGKYPFYANLGLLDLNGKLVCAAVNGNSARFLGDRFYFKQALATQSFVIGEYLIGRMSGRPSITFSMPVVDDKGVLSGVAFAALELEKLAGNQHLASPFPGSVIVTDRNGALVGADTSVSSRIGTQAFDAALFAAVKALPDQTIEAVDEQGKTVIYAAAGVVNGARPGLFVTASIAKEAVLAPVKRQLALGLALLSLFVVIGVAGARWVANRTIVEPTRRLLKQVNALAGSDSAVQPAGPNAHQSELAELTRAFNRMETILQAREAERDSAEQLLATRLRQQEAIAQLSVEVASASMLESVLQIATRCVSDALRADLCNVLQLTADKRHLLFVASVGWKPGLVGTAMVAVDSLSQAAYTLRAGEPVVVEELRTESRFKASALRAEHGVVSSISVTIEVQGKPWGVLGVHSRSARRFTPEDTHFMQSVASLLSLAIERMAVQAALLERSRSMNEAQRIAHLGSWEFDFASQALIWSDEMFRICGVDPSGFTASFAAYLNLVHPEDRARVQAQAAPMNQRFAPQPSAHRIVRPDGSIRHVQASGDLRLSDQGQAIAVQGALQDISEQKQAESREKDLSAKLTATLESITDGFFLLDTAWNFAYLNGQAERMLQRSRHDLLGKNLWQEFSCCVGSKFELEYRRAVEAQRTARFEAFFPPLDTWFDIYAHPTDEGLAVYFQDITARRLAQSQLRLLESAVSRLSDIVLIAQAGSSAQGGLQIVFVNDAFERRTGWRRDEVIGKSPEFLRGTLLEHAGYERMVARNELRAVQEEMMVHTKAGEAFWLEVNVAPLLDERGSPIHWVSVGRDITERRQASSEIMALNTHLEERVRQRTAQLEAANRELETFSYSVSHDLRSPLKTVEGFSHLLERAVEGQSNDKANQKARHYLSRIRAGVRQMAELIDGLLSLAQLSRDMLQFSVVDLSALARQVVRECRERDPDRRVLVHIQDTMLAKGDARLLLAVFQNLVGNAWKFSARQENAHIEIGSNAKAVDAMGETVYFIKDNGAGFDMAHADKLFGTFERLHSPADFPGTGIGLATVKRIIERHAGRVWAEGQENMGACFYFTLGRTAESEV